MSNANIHFRKKVNFWGLIVGLFVFFLFIIFPLFPESDTASKMTATALLMAIWWITEAIPLAITALLPLILFPLLSLISTEKVASEYMNSTIFLFLGGFLIAIAIEKWNLHKRISLLTIKIIGTNSNRIILGFMVASAFISMFISNTATAIMMLPIGLSVISSFEGSSDSQQLKNFSIALFLAIAYACSIGGIATLIGTAPNLVFQRIFSINFPEAPKITFGQWMFFGVPLSIVMLICVWMILTKVLFKTPKQMQANSNNISDYYEKLGKTTYEEKLMLIVLITTALLWIFRKNIVISDFVIPGWSDNTSFSDFIDDGTIAIFVAILLFIIPAKGKHKKLLTLEEFKKVPWDIIILFGGGFALAKGFQETGLSYIIGQHFEIIATAPPIIIIISICLLLTFLTELTSNTATTQTILPILVSISIAMQINPLLLMIPATISASFAFMLPVATPPNAIVFATGRVTIANMARAGLIINLIGAIIVTLLFYTLGTIVFNIDLNSFPQWLNK